MDEVKCSDNQSLDNRGWTVGEMSQDTPSTIQWSRFDIKPKCLTCVAA